MEIGLEVYVREKEH